MKAEENQRLTRVGPGTPGGALFRRYWQPALLSSELPEPDCAPVRVRLLGEDLLAFRDTEGRVGLVDAFCPHRRAPLFFGVIEAGGVRCAYHGIKFDRSGRCLELPSEPKDSPYYEQMRLKSYPTHEGGDLIWAYLGPKEQMPAPPDFEWMRAPKTHRFMSKSYEDCNYLQGLEGGLDTAHASFLHRDNRDPATLLSAMDVAPKLEVSRTGYGYYYTSERRLQPGRHYIRLYQYLMPAQQLRPSMVIPSGDLQDFPTIDGHLWVPADDEGTNVYNLIYSYDENHPLSQQFIDHNEAFFGRAPEDYVPGTFRLKRTLQNDYLMDRRLQKQGNWSGIVGINTQDFAMQEAMGKIVDRSNEFLTSTDRAIVAMRRMMLDAIRTVEAGGEPPGVRPEVYRKVRPHEAIFSGDYSVSQLLDHTMARW